MALPFTQLLADLRRGVNDMSRLNRRVPSIVGVESQKVIQENWTIQGYDSGSGVTPWKEREPKTNRAYDKRSGGIKGSVINSDSKILRQSGNLEDHITYRPKPKGVDVGVDLGIVPYAQIHNEGGTIHIKEKMTIFRTYNGRIVSQKNWRFKARVVKVGAHVIKMPKRQFMPLPGEGMNPKMGKRIKSKLSYEYDLVMKNFSHAK